MIYGIKSGSKSCDCENCIHGDVAKEARTIRHGNTVIYQSAGGINCTCKSIHNLTITDEGVCCSEYRERGE